MKHTVFEDAIPLDVCKYIKDFFDKNTELQVHKPNNPDVSRVLWTGHGACLAPPSRWRTRRLPSPGHLPLWRDRHHRPDPHGRECRSQVGGLHRVRGYQTSRVSCNRNLVCCCLPLDCLGAASPTTGHLLEARPGRGCRNAGMRLQRDR